MKASQEISTERLVLAAPRSGDAPEIFQRYASDPEVTRYLGWARHRTVADTKAFVAFSASEWQRSPAGPYLIRSRADGRLLGGTGLEFERSGQTATGYVLAKDAWGLGYATEALAAMVELARDVGAAGLSAICHPEHRASWRVLEKCGFTRRTDWSRQAEFPNLAPGHLLDVARYEIILKRPQIQSDSGRFISYAQVRERSLAEIQPLEQDVAGESPVASETRRLRRVPLKQLRIEDLRLLIGQGIGLPFLMPMAVAQLEAHPFAAGDSYPGDLLKQVIDVDDAFWTTRRDLRTRLIPALELALERISRTHAPGELEGDLRAALARHAAALRRSAG